MRKKGTVGVTRDTIANPIAPRMTPRRINQNPAQYPPGAPSDAPRPMLPQVPAPAYDPPVPPLEQAPAAPVLGIAGRYEAKTIQVPWPNSGGMQPIFTTRGPWRACDVYIDYPTLAPAANVGCWTVLVYAIGDGGRTLVATGRFSVDTLPRSPQWVVAARAQAEKWEVDVMFRGTPGMATLTNAQRIANITVVASDEANDPPPDSEIGGVGVVPATREMALLTSVYDSTLFPFPELVAVQGVNTGAAMRWLCVVEGYLPQPLTGRAPIMAFPLGIGTTGAGVSRALWPIHYRPKAYNPLDLNPGAGVLSVCQSSNPAVIALTTDCLINAYWR